MARKTLPITQAVKTANTILGNPDVSPEYKMGVAALISRILQDADQYAGFTYNGLSIHPVENRDQWTPEMEANRFYFVKGA